MKKRKRKGFTLIELLAVVIILAIIIGITIPSILNTINSSKNNTLGVAVDAAQKWSEEQITIYNTNSELIERNFIEDLATGSIVELEVGTSDDDIVALGLKTEDVKMVRIIPHENGEVCVIIADVPAGGAYYNTKYWEPQFESEEETAPTHAYARNGSGTKNRSSHCTDDDKLN